MKYKYQIIKIIWYKLLNSYKLIQYIMRVNLNTVIKYLYKRSKIKNCL
jgi:hypothetical protein